jgi:hypothetical protein
MSTLTGGKEASVKRRLMMAFAAGALLAVMVPGVALPVAAAGKVTCHGHVATIVGTKGPDVIIGTNGRDVIAGLGGNDIIDGRGGNDLICGGAGADRVVGAAGLDVLDGNGGPDRLFGGNGPDRLFGGVGDDVLAGQAGNDHLNGLAGIDRCYQGAGNGAQVSCELPDTDGDGYADHVDACPTQGDQGHGLDATGCPINFKSVCEDLGGTYDAGPVSGLPGYSGTLGPVCTWTGMTIPEWQSALANSLPPVAPCSSLNGTWQANFDPDWLGCASS